MKKLQMFKVNTTAIFEKYNEYDLSIAKIASSNNFYLIGGAAIDLLCNYYSVPSWRSRSNNDLDFWVQYENPKINNFIEEIKKLFGFEECINSEYMISLKEKNTDVDILIDRDINNNKFWTEINGFKVMHPIYLFTSKFGRYLNSNNKERKITDFKDLQILLKIVAKLDEFNWLEDHLSNQLYDQNAENELNKIIEESIINDKMEIVPCKVCSKPATLSNTKSKYRDTCSMECSRKLRVIHKKEHDLKKYGTNFFATC